MIKRKHIPIDWYIGQDMLAEDLVSQIMACNNPAIRVPYQKDVIKLDNKSMKIILQLLSKCIQYYLKDCEIYDNGQIVVEPFRGLKLYSFDEPGATITNKLTGQQMYQTPRRRFGAFFTRYMQRVWNGFDR